MMVPLGPDFTIALGISSDSIGWINGTYSLTGAFSALLASRFLDRFPRKPSLLVALAGLSIGNFSVVFVASLSGLLVTRVIAGMFSAAVYTLCLAVIIDLVAEHRRGRALGAVMASFSVASVAGIPAGLELARIGGWKTPFIAMTFLALLALLAIFYLLPAVPVSKKRTAPFSLLKRIRFTPYRLAFILASIGLFGNFLLIPVLPAYLQFNLGFPREQFGLLYLIGGCAAFFFVRLAGFCVDRWSGFTMLLFSISLLSFVLYTGFLNEPSLVPVLAFFPMFMVANTTRHVTVTTVITKVPMPDERAGFMSVITSLQNFAIAAGSFIASLFLTSESDGRLIGISHLAMVTLILAICLLPLLHRLETLLRRRQP